MRIVLASDHAGFAMRRAILEHLQKQGFDCLDLGAPNGVDPASWACYGDVIAKAIQAGQGDLGVAICGTGIGISISVNKHEGVRGALCCNEYMARMARQHNDANVLCMGARVVGSALALSIVDAFLSESFETGGRHQARVDELSRNERTDFDSGVLQARSQGGGQSQEC